MKLQIVYGATWTFPSVVPVLQQWQGMGYQLWVVSEEPPPKEIGKVRWSFLPKAARNTVTALSWTTSEWEAAKHAVGVVCLWELAVVGSAELAKSLGLPGPSLDAATRARDKWFMATAWKQHASIPATWQLSSPDDLMRLLAFEERLVVKPRSAGGSYGVRLVNQDWAGSTEEWQELKTKWEFDLLAQKPIQGPEFSVEGFVDAQGVYHPLGITRTFTTDGPHFVEIAHVAPAKLTPIVTQNIYEVAYLCNVSLGLSSCVTHFELKLTDFGPVPIELGARVAGGRIPYLWKDLDRFDLYDVALALAQGLTPEVAHPRPSRTHSRAAAIIFGASDDTAREAETLNLEIMEFSATAPSRPTHWTSNNDRCGLLRVRGAWSAVANLLSTNLGRSGMTLAQ